MDFFGELASRFGLPVAILATGLLIVGRVVIVLWRNLMAQHALLVAEKDKQIASLEVERDYYRDKLNQSLGLNEATTLAASALARGKRGTGR